jgi:hypothetical protein
MDAGRTSAIHCCISNSLPVGYQTGDRYAVSDAGQVRLAGDVLHVQTHLAWTALSICYQKQMYDLGLRARFRNYSSDKAAEWLRQHMPVGSFFGMLAKFHEKQQESNRDRYNWSQDLNCHVHHFSDWNDTVSMLARIL